MVEAYPALGLSVPAQPVPAQPAPAAAAQVRDLAAATLGLDLGHRGPLAGTAEMVVPQRYPYRSWR